MLAHGEPDRRAMPGVVVAEPESAGGVLVVIGERESFDAIVANSHVFSNVQLRSVREGEQRAKIALIHVDDHELSWAQFGTLLLTHGGWGMRMVFVPDDRLDEEPAIEVREPDGQE